MSFLKENGIPCGAYYPRPVNKQTAYAEWNTRSLPVCENLSKTALSIPMTPYLDDEDLDYIISKMNEFAAKKMDKMGQKLRFICRFSFHPANCAWVPPHMAVLLTIYF